MAEIDRPGWCPDRTCLCLLSYDENLCVGRLKTMQYHEPLFNTHRLCEGPDEGWLINDADAYYYSKLMTAVRQDITDHNLYQPGRGEFYDFGGTKK